MKLNARQLRALIESVVAEMTLSPYAMKCEECGEVWEPSQEDINDVPPEWAYKAGENPPVTSECPSCGTLNTDAWANASDTDR